MNSKDYYYPTVFARSLASKSYLASQLLHLFPNIYIDENSLLETQKAIDKYVNKKVLMPKKNSFLNIQDGGTSTPNLYLLYLSAKVTCITKLRRQYEKLNSNSKYMVPTWASTLIEIFKVHGIEIKHLNMIGRGDIEYIAMILQAYKLYFWSVVFFMNIHTI